SRRKESGRSYSDYDESSYDERKPRAPLGMPVPRDEKPANSVAKPAAPAATPVEKRATPKSGGYSRGDQGVDMFGDIIGEKRRFGKPVREPYDPAERSVRRAAEDRRLKKQSDKSARNGNFPSQEDLEGGSRPPRKDKFKTGSKYIPTKN